MTRKLNAELSALMRARIPVSDTVLKAANPNTVAQWAMRSLEGVLEEGGNNRGKVVGWIQSVTGGSLGDSWCMYAWQCAVAFAEFWTGKQSPVYAAGHCKTVADYSPECRWHPPLIVPGALAVVWLHGTGPDGHVGEILGFYHNLMMFTCEGNTSSGPGLSRDGDGFFHRMRKVEGEGDLKPYAYLVAFPDSLEVAN